MNRVQSTLNIDILFVEQIKNFFHDFSKLLLFGINKFGNENLQV